MTKTNPPRGGPTYRKMMVAIIAACEAMLAGEEGEGDWPPDVAADDLKRASRWAKCELLDG
jgi:hypothetical protein